MEMQGAVGIHCETVDGGNTFADDCVIDWGLEAFDGDVVFAGPRIIDVVHEPIDESRKAVDVGCETVDEGDTVDEGCEAAKVDVDVEDRDGRAEG